MLRPKSLLIFLRHQTLELGCGKPRRAISGYTHRNSKETKPLVLTKLSNRSQCLGPSTLDHALGASEDGPTYQVMLPGMKQRTRGCPSM